MLGVIFRAWGRLLIGYKPFLSIELTRECPLSCPGCYAYGDQHLGGQITLRQVRDLKGQALIDGVLGLLREHKPSHVSLVGGEPLVRYRELDELLPQMATMGIQTQLVTSAVRRIPQEWALIPRLGISVSIDGLQPEHDERRKPATYERILKNIAGHQVSVHCTLTHQQLVRDGYLEEFVKFWSDQPTTKRIWMSLFTPQKGENSKERLTPEDRWKAIQDLLDLKPKYPKLDVGRGVAEFYENPPNSPGECTFARLSTCISADFEKLITPCQFGGNPDCKNCGCIASAGMDAVQRHQLPFGIRVGQILDASLKVGACIKHIRNR
ncbi:radical SAM protein [bacterium]|nr:radical SAM protein [bacterium]MCI0603253.1 radical SAM protein [bacterium]